MSGTYSYWLVGGAVPMGIGIAGMHGRPVPAAEFARLIGGAA